MMLVFFLPSSLTITIMMFLIFRWHFRRPGPFWTWSWLFSLRIFRIIVSFLLHIFRWSRRIFEIEYFWNRKVNLTWKNFKIQIDTSIIESWTWIMNLKPNMKIIYFRRFLWVVWSLCIGNVQLRFFFYRRVVVNLFHSSITLLTGWAYFRFGAVQNIWVGNKVQLQGMNL